MPTPARASGTTRSCITGCGTTIPASAPNLVTITVDGKRIDAVVQLTKQGWAFVFDRVTGKPVWPIEERAVPRSDVPGEASWPTQPFPTKPPAFESQGVTLEDAFDATPELKDTPRTAELKKYRLGPIYTPPSLQGTVDAAGRVGRRQLGRRRVRSRRPGRLFVKTSRSPGIFKMEPLRARRRSRMIVSTKCDAEWTCSAAPRPSSTACRS